jgi:hypothetical protein
MARARASTADKEKPREWIQEGPAGQSLRAHAGGGKNKGRALSNAAGPCAFHEKGGRSRPEPHRGRLRGQGPLSFLLLCHEPGVFGLREGLRVFFGLKSDDGLVAIDGHNDCVKGLPRSSNPFEALFQC